MKAIGFEALNEAKDVFATTHHRHVADINEDTVPVDRVVSDADFAAIQLVAAVYLRYSPETTACGLFVLGQMRQLDHKAMLEFAKACGEFALAHGMPYQAEYDAVVAELAKLS